MFVKLDVRNDPKELFSFSHLFSGIEFQLIEEDLKESTIKKAKEIVNKFNLEDIVVHPPFYYVGMYACNNPVFEKKAKDRINFSVNLVNKLNGTLILHMPRTITKEEPDIKRAADFIDSLDVPVILENLPRFEKVEQDFIIDLENRFGSDFEIQRKLSKMTHADSMLDFAHLGDYSTTLNVDIMEIFNKYKNDFKYFHVADYIPSKTNDIKDAKEGAPLFTGMIPNKMYEFVKDKKYTLEVHGQHLNNFALLISELKKWENFLKK